MMADSNDFTARKLDDDAKLEKTYTECLESLIWSFDKASAFVDKFSNDLDEAVVLRGKGVPFNHSQNTIKAIDTFCDLMPTGGEKGNYYAVDFGGTFLRIVCGMLQGNGIDNIVQSSLDLRKVGVTAETPEGLLSANVTATQLFDMIASETKKLMIGNGDDPTVERPVSFTFSFPLHQRDLKRASLIIWTKDFKTGQNTDDPVEGRDVADLLNQAFKRQAMKCSVGAISNDTVGTLISGGFSNNKTHPTCLLGVILGTGFNIAAYDPHAKPAGYVGSIVNYECCNYDGVKNFSSLIDAEMDFNTVSENYQLAEKMTGSYYLGELCRLAFIRVFQYRCPQSVYEKWIFTSTEGILIYNDNTKRYKITQKVLSVNFGWIIEDENQLRMIYKIVSAIFNRSSTVAGLMTAVIANRTGFLEPEAPGLTVAIDGSLYLKNNKYRKTFRKTLDTILGDKSPKLHIVTATDGSGKGAAIIAACQMIANPRN